MGSKRFDTERSEVENLVMIYGNLIDEMTKILAAIYIYPPQISTQGTRHPRAPSSSPRSALEKLQKPPFGRGQCNQTKLSLFFDYSNGICNHVMYVPVRESMQ